MPRYIDADAFLLAEIERCGSQPVVGTCTMDNEYLSIRIAAAPTISPDEVRGVGKWVDKGVRAWSCSCCGTPLNHIRQFASFEKNELPNYCPNCGARMKGAKDETTD